MTRAFEQLDGLSNESLAGRAAVGCSSSFELLVRRLQAPLLHYLMQRLPTRADAEDALQDTFVRAYRKIEQFDPRWKFSTWLFAIGNRIASDRRRSRQGPQTGYQSEPQVGSHEAAIDGRDESMRLWSIARSLLTSEQHQALWLFYVEDLSAVEIAKVLNRSWVSVKTMLHRARKTLEPHLRTMAEDRPAQADVARAGGAS